MADGVLGGGYHLGDREVPRLGYGAMRITGEGDKAKAEVDFAKLGRKTLLLRYAPLSRA